MPTKRVVLAEYFTVEDRTLLFIVRNDFDEPKVIEIPVGTEAIQEFVIKHFQQEIQEEKNAEGQVVKRTVVRTTGNKVRNLDEVAYQSFFEPFVTPLVSNSPKGDLVTEKDDIIWLVPHNFLHYLPLHALKVEGCYLIERNPVCYTPSASVMQYCYGKRKERRENALVLGISDGNPPLPQAREEALMVAKLFNTEPYLNERATKSLVKDKLIQERESFDVLHFCCHGRFRQDDALKSCIVLAPEGEDKDDDEQWKLTAEEIFSLQMKADLVTLSACETGINENRPGDELIGLTRALIYAGTPSVIVSLWEVEDLSTGLLMQQFYQTFRRPAAEDSRQFVTKAEALQAAQLYVKNLPATELIAYCNQRLAECTQQEDTQLIIRFLKARANIEILAGDLEVAITSYQNIQKIIGTLTNNTDRGLANEVAEKLDELEFAKEAEPPIDYDFKPFDKLFNWAPFVLVGDWK
jgi:CHAT domain-containing protein